MKFIVALVTGEQRTVTASFVLPSLIEQGLGMALQNRIPSSFDILKFLLEQRPFKEMTDEHLAI